MQRRSQPILPQVCDELVDSRLLDPRFILWLHLNLGFLEGDHLCLEFVIVLFQCLLLSSVIAVESRLVLVAI